jgi:hypothetical protein
MMNNSTIRRCLAFAILLLPLGFLLTGCPEQKKPNDFNGEIVIPETEYTKLLTAINHNIKISQGLYLTDNFKKNEDSIMMGSLKGKDLLPVSETFFVKDVMRLLQQKGCVGLRIYPGMKENKQVVYVLCGVDANGADMLPAQLLSKKQMAPNERSASMKQGTGSTQEPVYILLEEGQTCPPYNPPAPNLGNPTGN